MRQIYQKDGFTLIELIVSLAISVVIAAFVFSFASSLAQIWKNSDGQMDAELDANLALDQIARDLESAILEERGLTMFAVDMMSKADIEAIPGGDDGDRLWKIGTASRPVGLNVDVRTHHYGWAGTWLRFFSSQPSVNAVSYRIIRRSGFTDPKTKRYMLNRSVVRNDETLEAGWDITAGSYIDGSIVRDSYDIAPNIKFPTIENSFLENVVDFGLRLYIFDKGAMNLSDSPDGLRLIFPADANSQLVDTDITHYAHTRLGSNRTALYPDVVEIFVRVLTQNGADLLRETEEGSGTLSYESIVDKHSRVYRRTIRMTGATPEG